METCPGCGMEKAMWKGNDGEGVKKNDETYCCQGCAEGGSDGCTCM